MRQLEDRKKAIGIALVILVVIAILVWIGHMVRDGNSQEESLTVAEGTNEIDTSYKVVEEVADYTVPEIYEVRVYNSDRSMGIYCNGSKENNIGTALTASSDPIISFHPEDSSEKLTTLEPYKVSSLENVFDVDLETSEKFVGNLLNNDEYVLIRSIKTSDYCDMYLKKGGNYRRIIVTSKRLIDKEFVGEINLKNIRQSIE